MLQELRKSIAKGAYGPKTRANNRSKEKRYLEFCEVYQLTPFPIPEAQIADYAMYLAVKLKSIQSIKNYCATACIMNERRGFKLVRRGKLYQETIQGIRKQFQI